MTPMNSSNFPSLLTKQLTLIFGQERDQYPLTYPKYFDEINSNQSFEQYQEVGAFKKFTAKAQGTNSNLQNAAQGLKTILTNISYSSGFEVTHELQEDDLYNIIQSFPGDLAQAGMRTKEIVATNILVNAFNVSFPGVDGLPLASVAHPTIDGPTYANRPVNGASLSETSLRDDFIGIQNLVDSRGEKMMATPQCLIIEKTNRFQAQKLMLSTHEVATANNAINPVGPGTDYFPKGYVVPQYLTSPFAYFIRTNVKGLIFQNREDYRLMDVTVIRQLVQQYIGFYRAAWGWYDPRSIWCNPGI